MSLASPRASEISLTQQLFRHALYTVGDPLRKSTYIGDDEETFLAGCNAIDFLVLQLKKTLSADKDFKALDGYWSAFKGECMVCGEVVEIEISSMHKLWKRVYPNTTAFSPDVFDTALSVCVTVLRKKLFNDPVIAVPEELIQGFKQQDEADIDFEDPYTTLQELSEDPDDSRAYLLAMHFDRQGKNATTDNEKK